MKRCFGHLKKWFNNLKVSQKLMLICIFFVMPDTVMLYLFITGINANIASARLEKKGNDFQPPLEELLNLLPQHRSLAQKAISGQLRSDADISRIEAKIDAAFDQLESLSRRIGADLQFTDESLAKRKREQYRPHLVRREWEELKSRLLHLDLDSCAERHLELVAAVRAMITHAGDMSYLILDPDLDGYYLMDAALLALPQNQDRLAAVMAHGETVLKQAEIPAQERQQFAVYARLLQEADLDRITSSLQTALNEDPNFYGISPTLQARIPPALKEYTLAAENFIEMTRWLADSTAPDMTANEYVASGAKARAASFALWKIANQEFDTLLQHRIDSYARQRTKSLIVAAFALLAAVSFVTFITRSISSPLQLQATLLTLANEALEAEVAERKRAEKGLRRSEAQLAAAQKIAGLGSWGWDVLTNEFVWSRENYRLHGFEPYEFRPSYDIVLDFVHPEDRARSDAAFKRAVEEKKSFAFEQRIIRMDGQERILYQRGEVVLGADRNVSKVLGTAQDITDRKYREQELERVHKELLGASRRAGMAEVATGVLHNVGNVLNSVNVSAMLISERLSKSRISHLVNVAAMLRDNAGSLAEFLTRNPKGKMLPNFVQSLTERLEVEQSELLREIEALAKNISHIKDIVAVQQNYAKVSGIVEAMPAEDLVEDALQMNEGALGRHGIEIVRDYADVPLVRVDKHKVLQILINVIRNAKHATYESDCIEKRIAAQIRMNGSGRVKISIADNGVGIPAENLSRIFAHGFTTKKDGHGFGLHSSALAATEMGGTLTAHSDGPGKGATFILELPIEPANSPAPEEIIASSPQSEQLVSQSQV